MGSEFASAAMLRVLMQGLRDLGLPPLQPHILQASMGAATVDLDLKRVVVQHALTYGGIGCLIHLGSGVHTHAHEPTHRAMVNAHDPVELVLRWQRLERYIHSRHRLRIAAQGEQWMELTHEGVREGIFPSVHESLVVFGVIAALLQARGVRGVAIRSGQTPVFPHAQKRAMETWPVVDPQRTWRLSWQGCAPPLASAGPVGVAEDLYACSDWPQWQRQLVNHVLERLIDIPAATDAALALGVSLRTLQRDLKARGWSFSALVGDCRARMAALHLIESDLVLSEVGFLCGYADQAHFTREFGKRVGMPPQKYRLAFGAR
ncbi:MAG: helix-turn-helix transcriptional regulator [Limnohabitans sp.]